jgi:protein-tyrosine-phosphatase
MSEPAGSEEHPDPEERTVGFGHMARETVLADGTVLADHVRISSAGTGPWHEGEPMDPRAVAVLDEHGYKDHGHVAR